MASVQITLAESFGVGSRRFYESAGALRDVVQNHLFQIVALLAMEPPSTRGFAAVHDEKATVFKAMRPLQRVRLSCAASTTATAASATSPPTPTSRRSAPCARSSTRGAGPACRGTCAPVSACR